jgi:hypothetical protein
MIISWKVNKKKHIEARFSINSMLMNEIEKNQLKKDKKNLSQPVKYEL